MTENLHEQLAKATGWARDDPRLDQLLQLLSEWQISNPTVVEARAQLELNPILAQASSLISFTSATVEGGVNIGDVAAGNIVKLNIHQGDIFVTLPQASASHVGSFISGTPSELSLDLTAIEEQKAQRTAYLVGMVKRYSTVTLPIHPTQGFSLEAIFQPLKLRFNPLAADDLVHEERRTLLEETPLGNEKPNRSSLEPGGRQSNTQTQKEAPVIAESIADALQKSTQHSIIVLGSPGIGKTTILKHLVSTFARKAQADLTSSLPVFISLPDLARSNKSLEEYLISDVQDMMVDERFAHVIYEAIKQGKAVVCLDSLDEVAPRQRSKQIELISEWASKSTPSIYIVGSRFTDYKGGQLSKDVFSEWEVQPMSPALRQELAKRLLPQLYLALFPMEKISEHHISTFVNTLETHEKAAAWGENPLLFSLAAVAFVRMRTLPASRTALYREVIDVILETGEHNGKMLRRIVADLALRLYQIKGGTFTRDDLLDLLPTVRESQRENWDTEESLTRIIASGILEAVAPDTYGFLHQTFQEYLGAVELARRLVSRDQPTREGGWHLAWNKSTYSRWTEVLRLAFGVLVLDHKRRGLQKAANWLKALAKQRKQPDGDPGNLCLALALTSLSEVGRDLANNWYGAEGREVEEEIVRAWVGELLDAAGHEARSKRLEALTSEIVQLNADALKIAEEILVAILASNDADKPLLLTAVKTLGKLGGQIAIKRLVHLSKGADEEMHNAVVGALSELERRASVGELLGMLNDSDTDVRIASVKELGKRGEQVPTERLKGLLDDPDQEMRLAAIEALGKLGERASAGELTALLDDPDLEETARIATLVALARLGERTPVEQWIARLEEDEVFEHSTALVALARLGEQAPVERLAAQLDDPDWAFRVGALFALQELGEQAPVERIAPLLGDSNQYVRQVAYATLEIGGLGARIPVEQLIALLDTPGESKRFAIGFLGLLGERAPIDRLIALLDDSDAAVRLDAMGSLVELGERAPIEELLVPLLNDPDELVRITADMFLRRRKPEESETVERDLALLDDPSEMVRMVAILNLGKLGERAPVERIAAMSNDPEVLVRGTVAQVLERLGKRLSVEQAKARLDDPHEFVRSRAIVDLWNHGERTFIRQLLTDMDDKVFVARTIGSIGAFPILLEQLTQLLDWPDWKMQKEAVQALGKLRRNIPDVAIRRLLEMRRASHFSEVRNAADDALAEILSLETGIEDDD